MKDMNKVYDLVIDNQILTTEKLNECGFNNMDIIKLEQTEKIRKNLDGTYEFLDTKKLFSYGKYLMRNKEFDKGLECFLKCLELNPKDSGTAFYLFTSSIRSENYEEAFKYLDILYNCKDLKFVNELNLYLYLISYLIDLPQKYKVIVENITFEEIQYNGYSLNNLEINEIRLLILKNKFLDAQKKLTALLNSNGMIHTSDYLVKKMLIRINEQNYLNKNILKELIINKDYEQIVIFLETKPKLPPLENNIYNLSKKYIEINKTREIPVKNYVETSDLRQAIEQNNFEQALELIASYNIIIYPILIDLIDLINGLLKKQIIFYLNNKDLDNAFISLKQFLINIGNPDFEQIVINIIKLSFMENDGFYEVKRILDLLEKTDNIDVLYYLKKYNDALANNKKIQSQIYLEIIIILEPNNIELINQLKRNTDLIKKLEYNTSEYIIDTEKRYNLVQKHSE